MAADGAVVGPDELLEQGLGRGHRPVHQHGPHDRDDAAPQARGPARDPHRARRRLPRVTLRLRLTALYTLLFGACGALLLGAQLVARAPAGRAARCRRASPTRALAQLDAQYALALGGMLLVAVGARLRWSPAARSRRSAAITGLARRVTQERLDERIAMAGPRDELRELADTLDGMLDRLETAFDGQRRFVANASHELRTPLTVIRAEVEVALADPDAERRRAARHGRGGARGGRPHAGAARLADGARAQPAGAAAARAGRPRRRRARRRRATAAEAPARGVRRRGSTSSRRRSTGDRAAGRAPRRPTWSRTRSATTSPAGACW